MEDNRDRLDMTVAYDDEDATITVHFELRVAESRIPITIYVDGKFATRYYAIAIACGQLRDLLGDWVTNVRNNLSPDHQPDFRVAMTEEVDGSTVAATFELRIADTTFPVTMPGDVLETSRGVVKSLDALSQQANVLAQKYRERGDDMRLGRPVSP